MKKLKANEWAIALVGGIMVYSTLAIFPKPILIVGIILSFIASYIFNE